MTRPASEAVSTARTILAGKAVTPDDLIQLVKALKKERAFGFARKVLDRCADDARIKGDERKRVPIAQQRALCTYKDLDLPADEKLETALRILREDARLDESRDRETLGLAGAVFKRRWELLAQERDLELSLAYYLRGYMEGDTEDYGYTGINAAFVLDQLADQEATPGWGPAPGVSTPNVRRERAQQIRREIAARLPALLNMPNNAWLKDTWWFLVTLAEAYFGLEAFDQARDWLLKAKALPEVPDWERESTARQLATLLLLKRRAGSSGQQQAEAVLREFLGNDYALTSVIRGRVGLAMSGGGFRASLYHIGVLARLAELDLLRSVEYLSCVSGGSIIGAYYYLEVRKLLRTKPDDRITRQDYIDIVKGIEDQFLQGVQRNIRTRILAEWSTSLKMIFLPDYSRTLRAGELYEQELYSRVEDGEDKSRRWLNELTVDPKGERQHFAPKDHNWYRSNKVPILILNATVLNTGHNWQFTATWMGEPPGTIDSEIDANYRLRRLYYQDDAPPGNDKVRLGYAVAASACVPGLFEPLALTRLYRRRAEGRDVDPIVRLVDGGVHDNQGVAALLDQGCNVLLVSDASGQMSVDDFPSNGMLAVPLRSNSILQARVREAQYRELSARRRSGLLKGLMFIHMKQDLETDPVDWIECQDPSEPRKALPLTKYGVQRAIQHRLAAIRTDLDSFSEAEAYALMCSGYLMAKDALDGAGGPLKSPPLGFEVSPAQRESWRFLRVEKLLGQPGENNPLLSQLKEGDKRFFKIWSLSARLKAVGAIVAIGLLALLAGLAWSLWSAQAFSVTVGGLLVVVAGVVLSFLGLGWVSKATNYKKTLEQILIGLGLVFVGAFLARLHLHLFDRLFLRQGTIERLVRNG